jgi:hypothetical protein
MGRIRETYLNRNNMIASGKSLRPRREEAGTAVNLCSRNP